MQRDPAKVLAAEAARIAGLRVVEDEPTNWPEEMESPAFFGLAGDFVRLVAPQTESDHVALLSNFIVASGVLFGREAYAVADGKKHYPQEYSLMVGATGSGRKGTATERVLPAMEAAEEGFYQRHILGGLSSGEGLIDEVQRLQRFEFAGDESDGGRFRRTVEEIPGRYLVRVPEFAVLLEVMKREGNTMSGILREAWDSGRLRVMTRKNKLDVDNVNLSIIAHITREELLSKLTATERANGFANRFLITAVRRSQFLPEGGEDVNLSPIVMRLHQALEATYGRGRIERDSAAKELWADTYRRLTRARDGIRGALCGRAEAHTLRLSLLYALLDGADKIRTEHLQAATAFWDYCERSISFIFGGRSGDADTDKILKALSTQAYLTMTELHRLFGNNRSTEHLTAKMDLLVESKKIQEITVAGDRKGKLLAWEMKR